MYGSEIPACVSLEKKIKDSPRDRNENKICLLRKVDMIFLEKKV